MLENLTGLRQTLWRWLAIVAVATAAFVAVYIVAGWVLPTVLAWARERPALRGSRDLITWLEDFGAVGLAGVAFLVVMRTGRDLVRGGSGAQSAAPAPALPAPPPAPRVFGAIPRRAWCFQPRSSEMRFLRETMDRGGIAALAGQRGAGKSQLAAALARQCIADGYDLVAWIHAEDGPITGLSLLAEWLKLNRGAVLAPHQAAVSVRRMLEATDGARRLIIFDNVHHPDELVEFLPTVGASRVIITTTRQEFASMDGVDGIPVSVFTAAEGRAFLREATGLEDGPDAVEVGEQMGWLPLGLAQVAAYIVRNRLSYRQYLAALNRQDLDHLLQRQAGAVHPGVLKGVQLSLAALRREDASGDSLLLLTVLSLMSPDGVSRSLLTGVAAQTALGEVASIVRALRILADMSLVTIGRREPMRDARDDQVVSVHRLTARVVRHEVGRAPGTVLADAGVAATEFVRLVTDSMPYTDVARRRADFEELAAHIEALRGHLTDPSLVLLTQSLWAGNALREAGDFARAAPIVERVMTDAAAVFGADHRFTLTARHDLALLRGDTGDAASATALLAELLEDRIRVLGPDHPDTLETRTHLADWRGETGDAVGAAAMLAELLEDQIRVLRPDHPHTLATRHNLAYWRGEAGDAVGAAAMLAELLEDQIPVLGPDHPHTLATRHGLGRWRGEAGFAASAVETLVELLGDRSRVLGADHPDTLATRHNLARWRGEAGDVAGAVDAFAALLDDRLRVLGPDHPHTLATRYRLAEWRGEAGDVVGAAAMLAELLEDQVRVLGADHPHTLATRDGAAHWLGRAGDARGAAASMRHALGDLVRVLGPDHLHTLATRHNVAYWRGEAGDAVGAAAMFAELLEDQIRVLGPDHPHTAATRDAVALHHPTAYTGSGQPQAARGGVLATRHHLADWRAGRVRRLAAR